MKRAIWIPVCELSVVPGVVSHVIPDGKTFLLQMIHPYTLKALEVFKGFKSIELALAQGKKRRAYFKYNKTIKLQAAKSKRI